MNLLALAFADGAFRGEGIWSPEDLSKLEVLEFIGLLPIGWKSSIPETPIFRRSNDSPFTAKNFSDRLKELCYMAGYPESLTTYVLRRGAANAIDCETYIDYTHVIC